MNTTTLSDDGLDVVLSDFFKAQMRNPWPAAPAAPHVGSEPSSLAAARAARADAPRDRPAARDAGGKARYTLAASVAILLGTCWALSNGLQPVGRPGAAPRTGPEFDLKPGTADGKDTLPGALKKGADRVNDNNGFVPPKIDLP